MKNKKFVISSIIIQCIYGALCLIDIVLCLIYRFSYDSSFGYDLAYFVLDFTFALFWLPAMPIGLILNISAWSKRQLESKSRKRWLIWTMLSPVVYFLCFFVSAIVFVATTGGV